MFEVGFSELCMVALVALLVVGPERLPKLARLAGFWIGKARNMAAVMRAEISAELQAEELRQLMAENSALGDIKQIQDDLQSTVHNFKTSLDKLPEDVEQTSLNPQAKDHERD